MSKIYRIAFLLFFNAAFAAAGLAADLIVTKTADTSDGSCNADCSLREAIAAANASAEADVIRFDPEVFATPQTITLSGSELVIQNSSRVTIIGSGAKFLTISGNNASRILMVGRSSSASIYGITFTGGNGIGPQDSGRGGALYNYGGNMLVSDCVISGNTANTGGGLNSAQSSSPTPAVTPVTTIRNTVVANNTSVSSGGGMQNFSTSTLFIENCLFTNNQSGGSTGGGGMQANGIVRISNSTFSGNRSPGGTGGGLQSNGGDQILTNVTVTGNTATNNGGGIHRASSVAGLFLRNTIIAGNTGVSTSPDVTNITNGTFVSQGNNIIGNVGTSTGWTAADLTNTDPLLTPLGSYGGSVMSHALLDNSPAIDAGSGCVLDISCTAANPPFVIRTDSRGAARFGGVDIGAYEAAADYLATLPSASVGTAYAFRLIPNTGTFTFSVVDGSFAPFTLAADTTLSGSSAAAGAFYAVVEAAGGTGTARNNYVLNVLADPDLVPVSGRVVSTSGTPVRNARVVLSSSTEKRVALTNGFGYFSFQGVPRGDLYELSASSREYPNFIPREIYVADADSGLLLSPAAISAK